MRNWAILIYTYWLDLVGATSYRAAKSKKAPAPDPAIGQAAIIQSQIGAQQLEFSKMQYEDNRAEIERMRPFADKIMQGQIDINDMTVRQSLEAEQHYKETFKPLEERFAADAAKAGSQEEQDLAAGAAGVDVQRQLESQKASAAREMASMGVNPNSGRFQGMDRSSQIMGAASKVGAMNGAAAMEKNRGDQMRQNAISIGRGIAGHSLASAGASANAGQAAIGAGQTAFNMQGQAGQQYMSGMGQAGSMYGQSASTYLGLHGAQTSQFQANQSGRNALMGGIGQVAGAAAMFM